MFVKKMYCKNKAYTISTSNERKNGTHDIECCVRSIIGVG